MITNAKPTGDDCEKCGNPNKMYFCPNSSYDDQVSEKHDICDGCGKEMILDTDYHLECDSEFTKEL